MKVSQLKPQPQNPRTVTPAKLAQLKKTMLEFGDISGVVFNKKTGHLVGGHRRNENFDRDAVISYTKKYKKPTRAGTVAEGFVVLKGERFAYREVSWPLVREKLANIAANKSAGEWNLPQLGDWMKELGSFDMDVDLELTMFDPDELKELGGITVSEHTRVSATTGVDEDDFGEGSPEPRAALGDVWVLGRHRLMCGDSTDFASVKRLMKSKKADICFTSPPYNAGCFGFDGGKSKYKKKGDDDLSQDDYFTFLKSFTDVALDVATYVFFNNQFLSGNRYALAKFFGHYAMSVKDVFPWIKNTAPPNVNKGVFTNRFEFFLCLEKGNAKKDFPVDWQGQYHNVIEGTTAAADNVTKGKHSATMPIYVPTWFLERLDFARAVYEPFGGSGTTLIACEKLGRQCFTMEIDPRYVDVILHRWETYTGQKAKRVLTAGTKLKKTPAVQGSSRVHDA